MEFWRRIIFMKCQKVELTSIWDFWSQSFHIVWMKMYEHLVVQRCSWKPLLHDPFSSIQIVHNMGRVVQSWLIWSLFSLKSMKMSFLHQIISRERKKIFTLSLTTANFMILCLESVHRYSSDTVLCITWGKEKPDWPLYRNIYKKDKKTKNNHGAAWPEYQFGHGINRFTLLIFWLLYCISACISSLATYTGCFR